MWVSTTFLLLGPLYNRSKLEVGLIGLIGLSSAVVAPFTGHFVVDRRRSYVSSQMGVGLIVASTIIYITCASHISGLIVSLAVLEIGVQVQQYAVLFSALKG